MWTIWQSQMKKVAMYQSRFLLSLIYFVFISPVAIAFKFFSDPLNLIGKSRWKNREEDKALIEELKNQ